MNQFTKGCATWLFRLDNKVTRIGTYAVVIGDGSLVRSTLPSLRGFESDEQSRANIELITAAFNSASKCAEFGYDGKKCVELLPELITAIDRIARTDLTAFEDVVRFAKSVIERAAKS